MAKVNVKLVGRPEIGAAGVYYGLKFEAFGKPKLSADRTKFTGVTLVCEGVDDKLVESLVEADKLEKVTPKELEALKEKHAEVLKKAK